MGIKVIPKIESRSRPLLKNLAARLCAKLLSTLLNHESCGWYVTTGERTKDSLVRQNSSGSIIRIQRAPLARRIRKIVDRHCDGRDLRRERVRQKQNRKDRCEPSHHSPVNSGYREPSLVKSARAAAQFPINHVRNPRSACYRLPLFSGRTKAHSCLIPSSSSAPTAGGA